MDTIARRYYRRYYYKMVTIMKQTHKTNIEFLALKEKHGLSMSEIAKLLFCSIDLIKAYTSNPSFSRHAIVPIGRLAIFKLLINKDKYNGKKNVKKRKKQV